MRAPLLTTGWKSKVQTKVLVGVYRYMYIHVLVGVYRYMYMYIHVPVYTNRYYRCVVECLYSSL